MTRRLYSGWPVMVMHNCEHGGERTDMRAHHASEWVALTLLVCVCVMNFRFTPASAQASGRPVPKPRGPPPCGVAGKKCEWREGCWWQSDGSRYKPRTGADRVRQSRQRRTDEQRRERQDAQAAAQRERRANLTDEQRRVEQDATARAVRACRGGVTPLWNALQLPVGQREDQLLYDLHASGSGFTTVNSMRLRTLKEGSPLHKECVNDVLPEIRERGHVTVADRARMVSAYAARQREAAQLRSCGCCGTRDPSMLYSEPKRLHELPMDHWARIDDAAYADLLNANVLELMNVSEEKVPVPRVEWHNCFECDGSAYHVIPEAVECDENGMPCIYVCKHCHKHWSRPRGEPVCERMDGLYDHLYWQGAPNDSVARGDDFGRLTHLKQKYGIEPARSRLEQLVLASVRTQYVSYKVRRPYACPRLPTPPLCLPSLTHHDRSVRGIRQPNATPPPPRSHYKLPPCSSAIQQREADIQAGQSYHRRETTKGSGQVARLQCGRCGSGRVPWRLFRRRARAAAARYHWTVADRHG